MHCEIHKPFTLNSKIVLMHTIFKYLFTGFKTSVCPLKHVLLKKEFLNEKIKVLHETV